MQRVFATLWEMYHLGEHVSEDNIFELSKKLDALLGLIIQAGKRNFGWSTDWAAGYLLEFDLSEECIKAVTGATEDAIRKQKLKVKAGKLQRPSFWDKFKEE